MPEMSPSKVECRWDEAIFGITHKYAWVTITIKTCVKSMLVGYLMNNSSRTMAKNKNVVSVFVYQILIHPEIGK